MKARVTKNEPEVVQGWHFLPNDGRLRHYDGRQPVIGRWLEALRPGRMGMHAALHPWDALNYAPGALLCRVELRGRITVMGVGEGMLVARERRVLAWAPVTRVAHEFELQCVERALKRLGIEDAASWRACRLKRRWLGGGQVTDGELNEAGVAAWVSNSLEDKYGVRSAASLVVNYLRPMPTGRNTLDCAALWESANRPDATRQERDAIFAEVRAAEVKWQRATLSRLLRKHHPELWAD